MSYIYFWLWDILVILLVQYLLEPSPKPEARKLPGRRSIKPDSSWLVAFIASSSETRQTRAECHTFCCAQIHKVVHSRDIQLLSREERVAYKCTERLCKMFGWTENVSWKGSAEKSSLKAR